MEHIGDESLENWRVCGSGGFGQIYRVKRKDWGTDVAVKLLYRDDGSNSSLMKEASMMLQGSSPHVLRIWGVYQGHPPGTSPQLGLVMEFMERGSLAMLQEKWSNPLPWPLAFRLAHQVTLGMNFLHSLSPPLLHLDLKPSNVLLDCGLNAKLTDFGLAKLVHSVSTTTCSEGEGGTLSYMPPEAFKLQYKPSKATDVYSYAILLWSIITGEQPYSGAFSSIVRFRITQGDRPNLESVTQLNVEGLGNLIDLMKLCWDDESLRRPSFCDCLPVTERLLDLHQRGINDAVYKVQKLLEPEAGPETSNVPEEVKSESPVMQELPDVSVSSDKVPRPMRTLSADPRLSNHAPQELCRSQRQDAPGKISIFMSNVQGLQIGNGNFMSITTKPRQRNITAPPTVNTEY